MLRTGHLLRDRHSGGLLTIGILDVEFHVHASVFEGRLETFCRSIQGGVLDQLVDTDGVGIPTSRIAAGAVRR